MAILEEEIRYELGIPATAQHVLILSMDAHMDWDWEVTFQDYLNGQGSGHSAVTSVINSAFSLMDGSGPAPSTYYYSICEMGFFEAAVRKNPALLDNFPTAIGDRLRIVGGGVTSPDNLLSNGEAIMRNYLIGSKWMKKTFGLPLRQAYVPDDFGNDSQFPTLLNAMGFQGVSFSRIPGSPNQANSPLPPNTYGSNQSLNNTLVADGVDFVWKAADGSTSIAHYMQQTYCQGNSLSSCTDTTCSNSTIGGFITVNEPSAPTPYIYVPCGCDFAMPITDLVSYAAAWNAAYFTGDANDVYCVVATLDHYIRLISTYVDSTVQHNYGPYRNLPTTSFYPTPFWTGCYSSRIRNKILHQRATRALLGAETFGTIADILCAPNAFGYQWIEEARRAAIAGAWKALVPSTHHDYVTGTAVDSVYTKEQVPLLASTLALGVGARDSGMRQIATQIEATPNEGEVPFVVFNQLGFEASGVVQLPPIPGFTPASVRFEDGTTGPVQVGHDGSYVFRATAPSLGYQAGYLSTVAVMTPEELTLLDHGNGKYLLRNTALSAVVESAGNWDLRSLYDRVAGRELFTSGPANQLQCYIDRGGIYRFGNEYTVSTPSDFRPDPSGVFSPGAVEIVENGAVRVWLRTTTEFNSTYKVSEIHEIPITGTYVRDYILVAGEPFLRMHLSGAAPLTADGAPNSANLGEGNQYSVMISFPFHPYGGSTIDDMTYGTPYHWVEGMPEPYWSAPIFQAAHNYVVPSAAGNALAAIYQSTIPAWGIDGGGALLGCVMRNTPYDYVGGHGANGQDTEVHSHRYAIRGPGSMPTPGSGGLLQESLQATTPLRAVYASVPLNDNTLVLPSVPATYSLASVQPSEAIITAAKPAESDPSELILRVYQPTNAALDVTVTLADQVASGSGVSARLVTALEEEIEGASTIPITNDTAVFNMPYAIATLAVGGGAAKVIE